MKYVQIENKEQPEAIDRLEFGIPFQREGAKPLSKTKVSNYWRAREGG